MNQERVLIIGAAGFVGGHLLKYLSGLDTLDISAAKLQTEKIDTDGFPAVSVYDIDILDKTSVDRVIQAVKPGKIIHLAAQSSVALSWKNPTLTMDINVNGTFNVLDSVREFAVDCRVLLVGSSEQYGKISPDQLPVKETISLSPENPYAISKVTQEMIANLYIKSYQMDIILVRAFNHIGPGQSPIFVVADFARQIAEIEKGLREPVIKVGNLSAKRDFTDVRDIVRGYWSLLEKGRTGEIYNIGQGQSIEVGQILKSLIRLSQVAVSVEVDQTKFRPIDVPEIVADISKIRMDTDWLPLVDIQRSLTDTISYWRSHV